VIAGAYPCDGRAEGCDDTRPFVAEDNRHGDRQMPVAHHHIRMAYANAPNFDLYFVSARIFHGDHLDRRRRPSLTENGGGCCNWHCVTSLGLGELVQKFDGQP